MPQMPASSPTTIAETCAKTWTSGVMTFVGSRIDGCSDPYVESNAPVPTRGDVAMIERRRKGSASDDGHSVQWGVRPAGRAAWRCGGVAQQRLHGGLCRERLGDLVANGARRLERRGDR